MKKIFYRLWLVLIFPVDLFRFTYDAWIYTFEMISYRWIGGHPDQPCIFCRGLDLGHVPRRISFRIKYHNLWMLKFFDKNIVFQPDETRMRPRMACMNEGGFVEISRAVPLLAVTLGIAWNSAFGWILWITVIPESVKSNILSFFS